MRAIDWQCEKCGAPLAAPPRARSVVCEFCNSRVIVTPDATGRTESAPSSVPPRSAELAELDREWMLHRDRYRTRRGDLSIPTIAGGIAMVGVPVLFAIIWIAFAIRIGAPAVFPAFGVLFIVFAIAGGGSVLARARRYRGEWHEFRRRRRELFEAGTGSSGPERGGR